MERHFALPIALAATLHAALLFGFRWSHVAPPVKPPDPTDVVPIDLRILAPAYDTKPAPEPDSAAKNAPDVERPSLPEPPPPDAPERPMKPVWEIPRPNPILGGAHERKFAGLDNRFGPGNGEGDGPGIPIISREYLDNSPRTHLQIAPTYPAEARRRDLTGEVVIEFVVDETGAVLAPRIVSSSDRIFEEPTLRALTRWRFEPGRRDGRIVRFRMMLPVKFTLDRD
jgi:protein TonB